MRHSSLHAADFACWVFVIAIMASWAVRSFARSDGRASLVRRWLVSAILLLTISGLFRSGGVLLLIIPCVILAFIWLPSFTETCLKPLTGAFDGGDDEAEAKPFYFTAEGKRRKGLYAEAMADVCKQLELFPGDYEGYMKLASIQMENLKDLPAAEATLQEFLAIPGHPANEVVSALHLLADWQLQHGQSAQAATASLQRVVQLYPNTQFAHAALQRIAHLSSADETARFRHESKFTIVPGERDAGLRQGAIVVPPPDADPRERVEELVRQLEKHPYDTDAREQLAILYAEEFQQLDLATDQLEQLIALPTEPPKHVAHWLNLLATLQIQHGQDQQAAEGALRRITERFPDTALASMAAMRLAGLNSEWKARTKSVPKALGNYERNVGLKR